MAEPATLRLDSGEEVRVVVEREDLGRDEITVHRIDASPSDADLIRHIDEHLAIARAPADPDDERPS